MEAQQRGIGGNGTLEHEVAARGAVGITVEGRFQAVLNRIACHQAKRALAERLVELERNAIGRVSDRRNRGRNVDVVEQQLPVASVQDA